MWRALLAASLLAGCATVDRVEQRLGLDDGRPPPPDTGLEAVMNAAPLGCPNGRTLEGANHEAFGPQHGVVGTDIALTPLASDRTRAVRVRRLVVEPGGVIAWHAHDQVQGSALVVSGEMTEIRNTCMDPIRYRAGDVAIEDAQTAHGWRNDGDETAIILTAHVVARN
ncbi:MAG: cupin domain-containing protein [Hyphomonadaceae bacterium]|nr:cupin domain-containing protein [Hyphomonadaceae bacterium]